MGPLKSLLGLTFITVSLLLLAKTAVSDEEAENVRNEHGIVKRQVARPLINRNFHRRNMMPPFVSKGFPMGDPRSKRNSPWFRKPIFRNRENMRFQRQTEIQKKHGRGKNLNLHSKNALTNNHNSDSPRRTPAGSTIPQKNRPRHPYAYSQGLPEHRLKNGTSRYPIQSRLGPKHNAPRRGPGRAPYHKKALHPAGRSSADKPRPVRKAQTFTQRPRYFRSGITGNGQMMRRKLHRGKAINTKSAKGSTNVHDSQWKSNWQKQQQYKNNANRNLVGKPNNNLQKRPQFNSANRNLDTIPQLNSANRNLVGVGQSTNSQTMAQINSANRNAGK